jgi:RND family efflux transporter MFP subunit
MYLWLGPGDQPRDRSEPQAAVQGPTLATGTDGASVTLSAEAIRRAGIVVSAVEIAAGTTRLRLPAVVEPNGYAEVVVTPLVAGRVTRVAVELGQAVTEGQVLAEVFSPELSEVQARYLTMMSEFDAAHERLRRTERLVEIGAASRQELERVRAEHTTHATDVETARARLRLLGASAEEIAALETAPDLTATVRVRAPRAGVVVDRLANVGLNVDLSSPLFRVVDLAPVWVIADLHEREFARVQVGSVADVSTSDRPGSVTRGRVTYIDPQMRAETRTARVRIELPNPGRRLRLGMYADVVIEGVTLAGPVVPRTAVQTIGGRQVVYVADAAVPGRFVARDVTIGEAAGDRVPVRSGLAAGDRVVVEGSFFLRAEAERSGQAGVAPGPHATHGPLTAPATSPAASPDPSGPTSRVGPEARTVTVAAAFEPARVTVPAGVPLQLTFIRTTDATCATEIVIPDLEIRQALPLNQKVTVEIPARAAGELAFACGMDMLKGTIVVAAR